ncbi:hypothetical protein AX16_000837 [Volvariella volvacea WC 439]|nr:hypothetical protein AX16_000837 [Volvariella volvacea WC 439]
MSNFITPTHSFPISDADPLDENGSDALRHAEQKPERSIGALADHEIAIPPDAPSACGGSPISDILPELLLEIMLVSKNDVEREWENKGGFSSSDPQDLCPTCRWISIAHVCRRWREVALGYPPLWASIWVSKNRDGWVDELLRRSDPAVLSTLTITLSGDRDVEESDCLLRFLSNQGADASRREIRSLFRGGYHPAGKPVSEFSPGALRGVEELQLWEDHTKKKNTSQKLVRFFARCSAPRSPTQSSPPFQLKSLSLGCNAWDGRLFHHTHQLDSSRLTTFKLRHALG